MKKLIYVIFYISVMLITPCLLGAKGVLKKSSKVQKFAILGTGDKKRKVSWESFTHYKRAVQLFNKNKFDRAEQEFKKAIKLDGSYFEPFFYLGNIYLNKSKVNAAKEEFTKAYKASPKNPEILYSLGLCYHYLKEGDIAIEYVQKAKKIKPSDKNIQNLLRKLIENRAATEAKSLIEQGKYREAIVFIDGKVKDLPNSSELYHMKGQALNMLGNYQEAIIELQMALTKEYKPASLFFDMGYVLYLDGQHEKAKAKFIKALLIKPDFFEPLFYLGNISLNSNDFDGAIKYFTRALAMEPQDTKILYALGISHESKDELDKALVYLKKAHSLEPSNTSIKDALDKLKRDTDKNILDAIKCLDKKDYKKALNYLNRAIKDFPDYARLYHMKGRALINLKLYRIAIENLEKALSKDAYNSALLSDTGYAYYQVGEFAKASKLFSKAIKINPKNPQAARFLQEISEGDSLFRNGVMHFQSQEFEKAIEGFSQAILNSPKDFKSYNFRGLSYVRLGEFSDALDDFTKALELNENNAGVMFNLGYTYYKMMDYPKAMEILQKSKILNPDDEETEKFLRKVQNKLIEGGYIKVDDVEGE